MPAELHMRTVHMPERLAFLERNAGAIKAAGPLTDTQDGEPGLWLIEAGSPENVPALVEADPFWPTGLRQWARVLQWNQVFADGKRLR